jgi:hypothetical protein
MNVLPTSPARSTTTHMGRWLLEVVRGRDVGRIFALDPGETVVGNALNGQRGLDLLDQEGTSPRRMAARHATFACGVQDLSIQDLETPGGTFVNQQRLLSGRPRKLSAGDVVQLGGVQLRVKQETPEAAPAVPPITSSAAATASRVPDKNAPTSPAAGRSPLPVSKAPAVGAGAASPVSPGRLPVAFAMAGGAQCRTWDDFLVLAAQRWPAVREELMSGRLAEYLRKIQRPELVPHITPDRSADDQLDEWLARVPASEKSAPELEVHPASLLIQAKTGGVIAGQSVRVTNVGYRLLRWTARVEPPGARWIRLRPEHDSRPVQTIEHTELPVELELPETIDRPHRAMIMIESNGGTRRIEVLVERPVEQVAILDGDAGPVLANPARSGHLLRKVARLRPGVRLAAGVLGVIALRLLMVLMNLLPIGRGAAGPLEPRLVSVSVVLIAAGVLVGFALVRGRGEPRDLPAAAFAGGALGLLTAAFSFAVVQSVERTLGTWSNSIWTLALFWGAVGAFLALASMILIPRQDDAPEALP